MISDVGSGVTEFKVGDRVAYTMILGTYAEYALAPAARVVPLPDNLDLRTAAGAMLQGLTAHYLTHSTYPLEGGRDRARSCGGWRNRHGAHAGRAAHRRARDRDRRHRRQSGTRAPGGCARRDQLHDARLRAGSEAADRRAKASTWSTTRWARTRSTRA